MKSRYHMYTTKKLMILLLAMLACVSVSAQDIMIDETCPPQFPGGEAALINFLNANIKYPPKAAQDKIEGKVIVQDDARLHSGQAKWGSHRHVVHNTCVLQAV